MARTGFEGSPEIGGGRAREGSPERGGGGGGGNVTGFYPEINPEMGGARARQIQNRVLASFEGENFTHVPDWSPTGRIQRALGRLPGFLGQTIRGTFRQDNASLQALSRALEERGFHNPVTRSQSLTPGRRVQHAKIFLNAVKAASAGRALNANQQAALAGLTASQKRSAGLFTNKSGKYISTKKVTGAVIKNLIAGKGLTRNQNALLGYALKNMTPGQRRELSTQLAIAKSGTTSTHVREAFAPAIGQAYRVSSQVAKNARRSTQIQRIAAARPTKVYTTAAGKTRTVAQILGTAVLYAKTGKGLRPTQLQALKGLNVNQLKRLGIPNAGRVAKQLAAKR